MKKILTAFLQGIIVVSTTAQNIGIDVVNPQARLEIKGINILGSSQSLLVKNFNNDSLLKVSNNGVVGIGSKIKDFSQLRIINNGKFNPHLVLQGTNFGPGQGRFFSNMIFTDTSFNRQWILSALVYGPEAGNLNTSKNGDFVIGTDSLQAMFQLTGEGRMRLGAVLPPTGFFQITGDWQNNPPAGSVFTPHINLVGTGIGSRSFQTFSTVDGLNKWIITSHHAASTDNSFFSIQLNDLADSRIVLGGDGRVHLGNGIDRGKFTLNHTSTATNPHLVLFDQTNTFSRLQFQNTGSTNYWNISAISNNTNASARMNFTNSVSGDILSITGDGKLGVGTIAPHATTRVHIIGPPGANTTPIIMTNVQEYATNALALAAGLPIGAVYRTGDFLKIVH